MLRLEKRNAIEHNEKNRKEKSYEWNQTPALPDIRRIMQRDRHHHWFWHTILRDQTHDRPIFPCARAFLSSLPTRLRRPTMGNILRIESIVFIGTVSFLFTPIMILTVALFKEELWISNNFYRNVLSLSGKAFAL